MIERLYYTDSFLYEFDAEVEQMLPASEKEPRAAVVLSRTAFYPTSGGQVFDTGRLVAGSSEVRVVDVAELEDGGIAHFLEQPIDLKPGASLHGVVDAERRRDHMQQHSGQHLLSAAFVELYGLQTLSFHMGEESCSIDLDAKSLNNDQVVAVERLSNVIVAEDRPLSIRFVSPEEAKTLGLRKLPPAEKNELRLIEIQGMDLSACGGTHVRSTGQIGAILLRKTEKTKQGIRVEFVCGERARATARKDYEALSSAASLLSVHLWDLPEQIRKSQEDAKAARKAGDLVQEELAELQAEKILASTPLNGSRKVVVRVFADRDMNYAKLLAQKLVRQGSDVIALLGTTQGTPALVFAQTPGMPLDMGKLMKEVLAKLGGRGGGSKDMAQGGPADVTNLEAALAEVAAGLRNA